MSETTENKGSIGTFVKETREEYNRISFPSWDDVKGTTVIVIANVIFFAAFLFVVDQAWVYILQGIEWIFAKLFGF